MKFAVIGAGAAGTTAAQHLREKAPQAEIAVFTDENYPYYGRPRLTEFLAGEVDLEQIYFHDEQWYKNNRINLNLGTTVTKIVPDNHKILAGKKTHSYDKLLLACGSRPNDLPIKGVHSDGVFTLWSIADAIHIKQFARGKKNAIILGAGFLGIEAANALNRLGLDAMLVDTADRLLPRCLDEQGARFLKNTIDELGITVVLGEALKSINTMQDKSLKVRFESGETLKGSMLLICAGAVPNREIAKNAGIVTNRGIIVDKHMRTSSPDIYAAGDITEFAGANSGIVPTALAQARVAATNMIIEDALEYEAMVSINTLKGLDDDLACIGLAVPEDESKYEVLRIEDRDAGIYKKAVIEKNRLVGAILFGSRKNIVPLNTIISRGLDISSIKESLLDQEANLHEFVKQNEE